MPLTRKDAASEGGAVYQDRKQYQRDLTELQFSQGKVLRRNLGTDVPLSKMSSDQDSFTGKEEGFFAKFGSKQLSK